MARLSIVPLAALVCATLPMLASAQVTTLVAVEPTSRVEATSVSHAGLATSLGKAVGQAVAVTTSDDMADVMRATRSAGYDVFIAPAQVAASALQRGYELLGATAQPEHYVLVGSAQVGQTQDMRGRKIYLPQQDSIYTYMARGMLNANGLSLKDLGQVMYARYPQAGLVAVSIGQSDATVIRRSDWDRWTRENPGQGRVLATSTLVPGGLSVVVKKSLPPEVRARIAKWFASSATVVGLKPLESTGELANYKAVAELGLFTPKQLPGAQVVTALDVQQLVARGAVLVDTRTDKEFKSKHVPGAKLVPYHEKSLKDVAFDAKLDDFEGLTALDKSKPTIFSCNGAECWKSYKASRLAIERGFKQVYWFRGGLPEWEQAALPQSTPLVD